MIKDTEIVITPGDPDGIGPEVTAKALSLLSEEIASNSVIIVGSSKPFKRYLKLIRDKNIVFFEPPERSSPGYQAGWSIETATQFVLAAPRTRVLVTGPISKERLQAGGYFFKGHTDFLANLTQSENVTMMLANEIFRVALVTDHFSLKEVPSQITPKSISTTFVHSYEFAKDLLKKKKPKIAILGINPHCGENGILGNEEIKVLIPTLKTLQKKYSDCLITGPHSADSFFAVEAALPQSKRHDVILAMYHDQGLIPVKLSNFKDSLNMTLGLPIIRTSVDHGTGFAIAHKNRADPSSMMYAIRKAMVYSKTRRSGK